MKKLKYLLLFVVLLVLDQITKQWAFASFSKGDSWSVIPKVLRMVYHENDGAAWGSLSGQSTLLILITSIAVIIMVYVFFKLPQAKLYTPLRVILVCIAAGAVGNNLIDRVLYGHVIDFIYFELIDFPVFNVADMYITISVVILALLILFYYKEDDLDVLKKKRVTEKQNDAEKQDDSEKKDNAEN